MKKRRSGSRPQAAVPDKVRRSISVASSRENSRRQSSPVRREKFAPPPPQSHYVSRTYSTPSRNMSQTYQVPITTYRKVAKPSVHFNCLSLPKHQRKRMKQAEAHYYDF